MRKRLWVLLFSALPFCLFAQDKWDLRRCVEYAMKNNVTVRQADIQARIAALQVKQAQLNQYPNANLSSNIGLQLGRSIDPTTNQFTTTQLVYNSFGLNGGVEVFNWGHLKNLRIAAGFSAQAALADIEKSANDIALTVATYYLQALAARQQIDIVQIQIGQTLAQLSVTTNKVNAGALPELNLAQTQAQLATDSSNFITAQATYRQDLLALKGALNLDPATPFQIETPPIETVPLEDIMTLQPESVYLIASQSFPQLRANDLRIKMAQTNIQVARSQMYPSISLGYNLGTNFSNSFKGVDFANPQYNGYKSTGLITTINGTNYNVLQPSVSYADVHRNIFNVWNGYGSQMNQNFRQSIGFSINVPIFNNGSYRINYERSKLDLRSYELQKEQSARQLKLDIYTAYNNALTAMEKFNAGRKSVDAAQKAYDFASKRYEVGLLSTIDLITSQNNLLTAKLQELNSQFEYVFRMKLLEFYKGEGLKL